MCGMKIVSVGTDAKGNINIEELRKAAEANKGNLSALMVHLLHIKTSVCMEHIKVILFFYFLFKPFCLISV